MSHARNLSEAYLMMNKKMRKIKDKSTISTLAKREILKKMFQINQNISNFNL